MTTSKKIVYFDDEIDGDAIMKFRLVYIGPLPSSRSDNSSGHLGSARKRKIAHRIRKRFHRQLKSLWERSPVLKNCQIYNEDFANGFSKRLDQSSESSWGGSAYGNSEKRSLLELVRDQFPIGPFKFAPVVLERYSVSCELDVLLLRRDNPVEQADKSVLNGSSDIDNRVKFLIDCLKCPKSMGGFNEEDKITRKGDEDDSLVARLTVEADLLHRPKRNMPDSGDKVSNRANEDQWVHAIVSVELKPYNVNMFNLMFA
jgi:hypothetical protein